MRLLVLLAVIYFGFRALRSWTARRAVRAGAPPHRSGAGEIADVMVQDPQCGIYLQRREGIALQHAGTTHYFCSQACRDAFLEARKSDPVQ